MDRTNEPPVISKTQGHKPTNRIVLTESQVDDALGHEAPRGEGVSWRNILAVLVACVLVAGVYYACSRILIPKTDHGSLMYSGLYENPDETCDVLFVGNSHAIRTFRVDLLWNEHGISSRVIGGANIPSWNAYYALSEAFKTQSPEVVVLEANVFFDTDEEFFSGNVANTIPPMSFSINKIHQIFASVDPDLRSFYLFDVALNHDRVYSLNEEQFTDFGNSVVSSQSYKGNPLYKPFYEYSLAKVAASARPTEEAMDSFIKKTGYEVLSLFPKHEEYLMKIIELCAEQGASLEIIDAPAMSGSILETFPDLKRICEENEIRITDYCVDAKALNLDWRQDFYDRNHLSWTGAAIVTRAIYFDVLAQYDLADHRGDSAYQSWDVNALLNEACTIGFRIVCAGKDADSLRKLLSFDEAEEPLRTSGTSPRLFSPASTNSLIPEATILTASQQMAAGAQGSPYQIVVDLTVADGAVALGDVVPKGVGLTAEQSATTAGVWLIRDGAVDELNDSARPYRFIGSFTLDYGSSLRYAVDERKDAQIPSLLISLVDFPLEEDKVAVLIYDARLDMFVSTCNITKAAA